MGRDGPAGGQVEEGGGDAKQGEPVRGRGQGGQQAEAAGVRGWQGREQVLVVAL